MKKKMLLSLIMIVCMMFSISLMSNAETVLSSSTSDENMYDINDPNLVPIEDGMDLRGRTIYFNLEYVLELEKFSVPDYDNSIVLGDGSTMLGTIDIYCDDTPVIQVTLKLGSYSWELVDSEVYRTNNLGATRNCFYFPDNSAYVVDGITEADAYYPFSISDIMLVTKDLGVLSPVVKPENINTIKLTANYLELSTVSYAASDGNHFFDNVNFATLDVKTGTGTYANTLQFKADTGSLINTTEIPGVISNIEINILTDAELEKYPIVSCGNNSTGLYDVPAELVSSSVYTEDSTLTEYTLSYDLSGNNKYFSVTNEGSIALYISEINIDYIPDNLTDSDTSEGCKEDIDLQTIIAYGVIICIAIYIISHIKR